MNRIRLLPETVANQIAAGEVVERPASVVKELVENAIDAQATRISVEIQAGGRALIRVTDDGLGMSKDDALLCLERHATSKIRSAADLFKIESMGFRGEAMPSIASVSRFALTTRERDNDSPVGTFIQVNGGTIAEVREAGCAPGTTVEVRQLFYNVPARRKFLKSDDTEKNHIHQYLHTVTLAHPSIGFTLILDGKQIWQLPPLVLDGSRPSQLRALRERLKAFFSEQPILVPVDHRGELDSNKEFEALQEESMDSASRSDITLWGFIGAPGVSRSNREDQHLFVNRRPVEHRGLNYALLEGYHTALMKGRYPICCLFIEIAPEAVDVNVHPSKKEVKFRHEYGIRRILSFAIQKSLRTFHGDSITTLPYQKPASPRSESDGPMSGLKSGSAVNQTPQSDAPQRRDRVDPLHLHSEEFRFSTRSQSGSPPLSSAGPGSLSPALKGDSQTIPSGANPGSSSAPQAQNSVPDLPSQSRVDSPPHPTPLLATPLRIVGVVGLLYVVLESDRGLVLLDQHAAHERVLFEQMLSRLESGPIQTQKLLLPETIELNIRDSLFIKNALQNLCRLGVGLSEFGERTYLLDSLPPFVKAKEPKRFVLEVIDQLRREGADVNSVRLGEPVIAKTVCRHAVKANDPLKGPEIEHLLADLRLCAMPYTCPHGRPTLIEFNFSELEKRFGRVQS